MTNVRLIVLEYGQIPNLEQCCSNHDIVLLGMGQPQEHGYLMLIGFQIIERD